MNQLEDRKVGKKTPRNPLKIKNSFEKISKEACLLVSKNPQHVATISKYWFFPPLSVGNERSCKFEQTTYYEKLNILNLELVSQRITIS